MVKIVLLSYYFEKWSPDPILQKSKNPRNREGFVDAPRRT